MKFTHTVVLAILAAAWLFRSLPYYAESIPPERWVAHGSGTLTCISIGGKAPGQTTERIAFQPAQNINTLSFRYKPSEQRPVVVKVSDSAGRSAYFNERSGFRWARRTIPAVSRTSSPARSGTR